MTRDDCIDAAARIKALAMLVHVSAQAAGKHVPRFEDCQECAEHRAAAERLLNEAIAIGQRRIDRQLARERRESVRLMQTRRPARRHLP